MLSRLLADRGEGGEWVMASAGTAEKPDPLSARASALSTLGSDDSKVPSLVIPGDRPNFAVLSVPASVDGALNMSWLTGMEMTINSGLEFTADNL